SLPGKNPRSLGPHNRAQQGLPQLERDKITLKKGRLGRFLGPRTPAVLYIYATGTTSMYVPGCTGGSLCYPWKRRLLRNCETTVPACLTKSSRAFPISVGVKYLPLSIACRGTDGYVFAHSASPRISCLSGRGS